MSSKGAWRGYKGRLEITSGAFGEAIKFRRAYIEFREATRGVHGGCKGEAQNGYKGSSKGDKEDTWSFEKS